MEKPEVKQVFVRRDKEPGKPFTSEDIMGAFRALADKNLDGDQARLLLLIMGQGLRLRVHKKDMKTRHCREFISWLSKLHERGLIPNLEIVNEA